MKEWIFPSGQYKRPKEEQAVYQQLTHGEFMNPWDIDPRVEEMMRALYTDEQLSEIYRDIWK